MTPYGSEEALESLRESKKKIESSLTPKARVFRRLKGGRPKKLGFDKPTPLQVVNTLFNEIERAHGVMREEGVDPKDLTWEIFYYARLASESKPLIHPWSPARGMKTTTKDAIDFLKHFDGIDNPLFLGIKWSLDMSRWLLAEEDENHSDDTLPYWETRFNAYPLNTQGIKDALETERGNKTRWAWKSR